LNHLLEIFMSYARMKLILDLFKTIIFLSLNLNEVYIVKLTCISHFFVRSELLAGKASRSRIFCYDLHKSARMFLSDFSERKKESRAWTQATKPNPQRDVRTQMALVLKFRDKFRVIHLRSLCMEYRIYTSMGVSEFPLMHIHCAYMGIIPSYSIRACRWHK